MNTGSLFFSDFKVVSTFSDQGHFRNDLVQKGLVERLFDKFGQQLAAQGFKSQKGQILDASLILVPKQRNRRKENELIKSGRIPPEWLDTPDKLAQKDTDARWTKKNGVNHFGYKNHISVDVKHQLIREYEVSAASLNDIQVIDAILDTANSNVNVYVDSAYRSVAQEDKFKQASYRSKVHHKRSQNHPLSEFKQQVNRERSRIEAWVEHIFGHQSTAMGGKLMRCIGIPRTTAQTRLRNLVYNMERLVCLHRNCAKLAS